MTDQPTALRNTTCLNIGMALNNSHRAAQKAVQHKQNEQQIPALQAFATQRFGHSTLEETGLLDGTKNGSIVLIGQHLRMMSELTTFFRNVLGKDKLLDGEGLTTFHQLKQSLLSQSETIPVDESQWPIMFTALVEWLQGEAAFCSSQHNNLQEMPLVLRECGLSTEADALEASLDMDVWKNHQTYLRSLLDHASTLTTPDQKMQFVMELAWLAGHQDGFYMMVEKEKAAASTTANPATVELELGLATEPPRTRPAAPQRSASEPTPGKRHRGQASLSDGSVQPTIASGARIPRAPRHSTGRRGTLHTSGRRLSEDTRSAAVHMQTGTAALLAASPLTTSSTSRRNSVGGNIAAALRNRRRRNTTGGSNALSFSGVLAAEARHPQAALPAAATGGDITPPHTLTHQALAAHRHALQQLITQMP